MSEIITVDENNLQEEHICCSISGKKEDPVIQSKKDWMAKRFNEGLVFKKLNERGKVFIEYIPAEYSWSPIKNIERYMYIDCFWVSGKFKGQGYANKLLSECISDAKAKSKTGLVVVSGNKKLSFLSDPDYLKYKGFKTADTAKPNFELLYLPFKKDAPVPKVKACAKDGVIDDKNMNIFYSNQCPFTDKYVELIKRTADIKKVELKIHKFSSTKEAQNSPSLFTVYSFFDHGRLLTTEIFSEKKFIKYLDSRQSDNI